MSEAAALGAGENWVLKWPSLLAQIWPTEQNPNGVLRSLLL
jgi:hypothetical protein